MRARDFREKLLSPSLAIMGAAHLAGLLGIILAGISIRWLLFSYGFHGDLSQSYELVTPVTSYERCTFSILKSLHFACLPCNKLSRSSFLLFSTEIGSNAFAPSPQWLKEVG